LEAYVLSQISQVIPEIVFSPVIATCPPDLPAGRQAGGRRGAAKQSFDEEITSSSGTQTH